MVTVVFAAALLAAGVAVVFARMWWITERECAEQDALIRDLTEQVDGCRAELDALSIAGPVIDTETGGHDRLPITDDNRRMLTDYIEGMWHHSQEMP